MPLLTKGLGFSPSTLLLGGLFTRPPTPPPPPPVALLRDRPILKLIKAALDATGEFHEVTTAGEPEFAGVSSESYKLASLELGKWKEEFLGWDTNAVAQLRTVQFTLTVHVRDPDPVARDNEADRLYAVAANAVNGNSFGDTTFTDFTYLHGGRQLPVRGAERRTEITGQFAYEISNWNTRNTTP